MTSKEIVVKDFKDFEFKSDEDGSGYVEGYAARYGNIDRAGDVILPGAFKHALAAAPNKVRFLWGHDKNQPIGSIVALKEDDTGLWFRAKFAPTITKAQETRELMLMNPPAIDSFSVGFRLVQAGRGTWKDKSVNLIKEGKIFEISAVPFPCNEDAKMTRIKSDMEEHFKSLPLDDQQLVSDFIDFLEQRRTVDKADATDVEQADAVSTDTIVISDEEAVTAEQIEKEEDLSEVLAALQLHRVHGLLSSTR